MNKNTRNFEEYIKDLPVEVQERLKQIRDIVKKCSPEAVELISYGMPAFKLNGKPLVYFAAFPKHIGFYPVPSALKIFKEEFSTYKTGKGSVQFPLEKKLPVTLITKVVKFRVKENLNSDLKK